MSAARLVASADDEGTRLDQFITARLPTLSRSQVQRLIKSGAVRLSRGQPKPSLPVEDGLAVEVDLPVTTPLEIVPEALPLDVLHQDADLIVVNKPPGLVVHPAVGHTHGTLVHALLHHAGGLSGVGGRDRPGIVHRLDRGTSGVMVIARHDAAHRALARQFAERTVEKEYIALVWGTVRAGGSFDQPIGRHPRDRKKMSSRARHARAATTRVLESEALGGLSLLRLRIATGRTHQIRVHLSESGHPVVGDALYGGIRRRPPPGLTVVNRLERPFLHAARLSFAHPTDGQVVTFDAPLPADLSEILNRLRQLQGK